MEINATLVVQMVLFLFLATWLSHFLFAPLLKLFEEREKRIQGARAETEKLQRSARESLEQVEETIRQAQREARQVLLAMKAEGMQQQRRILDEARREAKEKLDASRHVLATQVSQVQKQLALAVPVLAGDVESQLLKKSLNKTESSDASHAY